MIVTGPSDADLDARAAHFMAMLDEPNPTAEDLAALDPVRQITTLADQTGERPILPILRAGEVPNESVTAWRIEHGHWVSPFGKAFLALHAVETKLEALPVDESLKRKMLLRQLPIAQAKYKLEHDRSQDEAWRVRHRIDEELFYGIGTDERNTKRRKVRDTPNLVTGEPVTPEGVLAQKRASKERIKAAMTPEQLAAANAIRAEKTRLKRAEAKAKSALK
tara:strand:- start:1583 stop:2245 length:663 start_codon:yes stop_codon:yes gene_type:complete